MKQSFPYGVFNLNYHPFGKLNQSVRVDSKKRNTKKSTKSPREKKKEMKKGNEEFICKENDR
jgi:hypothetical protein